MPKTKEQRRVGNDRSPQDSPPEDDRRDPATHNEDDPDPMEVTVEDLTL